MRQLVQRKQHIEIARQQRATRWFTLTMSLAAHRQLKLCRYDDCCAAQRIVLRDDRPSTPLVPPAESVAQPEPARAIKALGCSTLYQSTSSNRLDASMTHQTRPVALQSSSCRYITPPLPVSASIHSSPGSHVTFPISALVIPLRPSLHLTGYPPLHRRTVRHPTRSAKRELAPPRDRLNLRQGSECLCHSFCNGKCYVWSDLDWHGKTNSRGG